MCDLLGLCFSRPVDACFSLRAFRRKARINRSGWGVAWYPDNGFSAQFIKEPVRADRSRLYSEFLNTTFIRSRIFISHLRRASKGVEAHKNTHPFYRVLYGRSYIFAHNGTLSNYHPDTGSLRPIGETDSEKAFLHILNSLKHRAKTEEKITEKDFNWLHELLMEINQYGTFNCLLSDGEYLIAYHDKNGYNGMAYVKRKPLEEIHLKDEDGEITLKKQPDLISKES